jgi:hypothetical protein
MKVGNIITSIVKSSKIKNSIYYPVSFGKPEDIALIKLQSAKGKYGSQITLDDLVDRAKNSKEFHGLVCYIIGENIAAENNESVGIEIISQHVQESTGAKRAKIARVLTFVYILSNNQSNSILSSFLRVLNQTNYSVYPLLHSIIEGLSVTVEDFLLALDGAIETGTVDTEHMERIVKPSFFADTQDDPHPLAHPPDSMSSRLGQTYNIQPYLEADEPIPNHVLTAFIQVLKTEDSDEKYRDVQSQIRAYLRGSDVPTKTKLKAIEVLLHL